MFELLLIMLLSSICHSDISILTMKMGIPSIKKETIKANELEYINIEKDGRNKELHLI